MANILRGIQYRERVTTFPDWRNNASLQYGNWQDVGEDVRNFSSYTEFRIKPTLYYSMSIDAGSAKRYETLDSVMVDARKALEQGRTVDIDPVEKSDPKTFTNHIQVNRVGIRHTSENVWQTVDWTKRVSYDTPIEFRVRPDYYYTVRHTDLAATQSLLTFDDADRLAKYVDNQIRTGNTGLQIGKVRYA